ncbi:hypothetical protein FLK61_22690 [Paenalkalicoccus suaedae]|uniref:DUF2834 domain-containing protein n=1 Tax=Paenalkalicoccus suaedae TaxID=2592382 RepID=A0A859F9U0_9BACI|nr:hypothetical protein [Paenalkalicoccus suaedae]QKS69620.1 hypothetical protein FLK61_22690 [Paenalkalicoccus suaedae]
MKVKIVVFLALLGYALFLAPGANNADDTIFTSLITGSFDEVDPLVVAVFSMLGLYPLIFAMLLLPKDVYRIPAWPFSILAFGLGAFPLLPYLIIRGKVTRQSPRGPGFLQKALLHPLLIVLAAIIALLLYVTALQGSISAFQDAFMSSHLVSVMTVDFLVLIWLSYDVLKKEWGLRYSWLAFIPAFGPLVLLLMRKRFVA